MAVIISDPEILGGTPIFEGTRIPIRNLFDYLLAGDTIKEFLDDFPTVSFPQVKHALQNAEIFLEKIRHTFPPCSTTTITLKSAVFYRRNI